jgi:uncharacterized phage-associated protein
MYSVDDVAAAFLEELGPMTSMKLQKLCYYAQAWHLAEYDTPLFANPIEAWRDGPVVRALWDRTRGRSTVSEWSAGNAANVGPVRRLIHRIAVRYGRLNGDDLSVLSHRETPWRDTRGDLDEVAISTDEISTGEMARYYRRRMLPPSLAARHAIASAELEGARFSDEFRETVHAVARGEVDVDDAVADVVRRYASA